MMELKCFKAGAIDVVGKAQSVGGWGGVRVKVTKRENIK